MAVEVLKNSVVTKDALAALQVQITELANSIGKADQCPSCHRRITSVLEHRNGRRRRECGACGHRFTTSEFTRL